jgi:hypothetical protein
MDITPLKKNIHGKTGLLVVEQTDLMATLETTYGRVGWSGLGVSGGVG